MNIEEQKAAQAVDVLDVMDNDRRVMKCANKVLPCPSFLADHDAARAIVAKLIERDRTAGYTHEDVMRLVEALRLQQQMNREALGKFNWGASALDAKAIDLLNRAPMAVDAALAPLTHQSKDGSK